MHLGFRHVEPTGRTRHRVDRRWGRERLVLQVEERGLLTTLVGPFPDTESALRWRDATTEDLTATPVAPSRKAKTRGPAIEGNWRAY